MMELTKNATVRRAANYGSSLVRLILMAFAAAVSASALATNTWYVAKEDANAADTPAEGRGSEALPFRTIQAALDNSAFEAGDIVLVKRGDYDEGERWVGNVSNINRSRTNRVYIAKTVHLKAMDGPEVTRIVGKFGTGNASTGYGGDGIRCVAVATDALGTVIEGFTFENGASFQSTDGGTWINGTRNSNYGGGLYVYGKSQDVYAVDCIFRNCSAAIASASYGATLIRCLIDKCQSYRSPSVLCGTRAFACVTTRCSPQGSSDVRYMLGDGSVAVNCTFHDNTCANIDINNEKPIGKAYNCIFAANKAQEEYLSGSLIDSFVSTVSTNMAFATGLRDYRLPADSPAIGTGSASHRQVLIDLGVPAKYLEKDFSGETIDWEAESFNPGATQGIAVPTTAIVQFAGDTLVNGSIVRSGQWIRSESFPHLFELAPADAGKTFCCFTRTGQSGSPNWPHPNKVHLGTNGIARIVLPLRTSMQYVEYKPNYAAAEIWVDPTSAGSDEEGDGSEASPYHTLQHAIDQVSKHYTVIHAKRGDYREGGAITDGIKSRANFIGKDLNILLKSVEGPEVTTIWGEADPYTVNSATEPGCGTNAVRCVCGRSARSAIQGFTLRDGHTLASGDSPNDDEADNVRARNGAAVALGGDSTYAVPPVVMDCIVTNCVSAGVIINRVFSMRCLIVGNTSGDAIYHQGYHAADIVMNNSCAGIFGALSGGYGRAWMVTAVGNKSPADESSFSDWSSSSYVYASIIDGGNVDVKNKGGAGNVVWNHADVSQLRPTSVNADPLFADKAAGDFRPAIGGPAVDSVAATDMSLFCFYIGSDYYGNPIRISADGKLTAGAVQGGVLPYAISASASSDGVSLLLDGVANAEARAATNGTTVTIAPDMTAARYAKGYLLNGVEHLFEGYPGCAVTLQVTDSPIIIQPIVSTEWHVDAENGNDATGNGFTADTAKKTLAGIFTDCAVIAGDIVYAYPGTYSNGVMRLTENSAVASRAIVPADVTLKAVGTPAETVILGAASDSEFANEYGQGTNAVRCVALKAGAVIDGFTLTGGRTLGISEDGEYDGYGGGVFGVGPNTTAIAKGCIISNNVAARGGGGAYASYVGCRIVGNRATSGNGAATFRSGHHQNCLIDGNVGNYTVMHAGSIYGCTIGSKNSGRSTHWVATTAANFEKDGVFKVFNSILYYPSNENAIYWNCALANDKNVVPEAKLLHGTFSTNYAALKLDPETLRPAIDSPVVDAGDDEKRGDHFPETDIDGVPRVLNGGRFDIGACEYDWRNEYSRILGKRVEVTDVTSNVVKSASSVRVPEGSLGLEWQIGSGWNPMFNASVTGEGSLSILLDGKAFATLDSGSQRFRLPKDAGSRVLAFEYSGDGYAELSDFSKNIGLIFSIR